MAEVTLGLIVHSPFGGPDGLVGFVSEFIDLNSTIVKVTGMVRQ